MNTVKKITLGSGKAVHLADVSENINGVDYYTRCGSDHQTNTGRRRKVLQSDAAAVTCKKCQKTLNQKNG